MTDDGHGINYGLLKTLPLFVEYKEKVKQLAIVDLHSMENNERMAFFINILIVCLISLELFILGVQANKLHFCNLELILNKTGYSHIMENKNFFFSFFNMGTS